MKNFYAQIKKRVKSIFNRRIRRAQVSVVVPAYNCEKTIERCLDALLNQSQRKIKIICVDDGSKDDTLKILREYEKRFRRVKVISQKNGGRSVARNVGLQIVRTKYVMFCDADDWYEQNMCENMIDVIERGKANLAICGIKIIYETHSEMKKRDEEYYKIYYEGVKVVDDELIDHTDVSVCNKIFRMDVVRKNDIQFPDKLNNEDYYFYNAYMSVSKTAYYLNQKLYNYVRHEGSIMSDNFDKKKMSIDHLLVAEKLFQFYRKNGFLEEHRDLFWRQWIASFWFSYEHSEKKYHKAINERAKVFLDRYYEKYEPSDLELQKYKKDIITTINKTEKK